MKTTTHLSPAFPFLKPEDLFKGAEDQDAQGVKGRGQVVHLVLGGHHFIRKQYKRGGLMRKLLHDRYLFLGLNSTRMAREYVLLEKLRNAGFPVPQPVAYQCIRYCPFTYQGKLVTIRLRNAETLGSLLRRQPLSPDSWARLGRTIGRFHRHGVHHADLNVENILLSAKGEIMLIDFDRGRILKPLARFWARNNLKRLKRSLLKQSALAPVFHFSEENWSTLTTQHKQAFKGEASGTGE